MSKQYDEKFEIMLNEFKEEQKRLNKLINKQNKKIKNIIVFTIILCLILSGISGVASYTLAANQVGYTARDTSWTVDNTQDAIDELRDTVGAALVGSIYSYMGTSAPFGYLACDGTEYNIADYPRLAEHINKSFGSYNYFGGDGSTTFAVPDLRGEFLRGTGTNSHTNQGSGLSVGTHQDATMHLNIYVGNGGNNFYNNSAGNGAASDLVDSSIDGGTYRATVSGGRAGSTWSSTYYTSRPTNTSVLYIIKY